jgi:hypothetical protein
MTATQQAYNEFMASVQNANAVFNSLIKRAITEVVGVDSGKLKNTSSVFIELENQTMMPIGVDINTTDYYKFLDKGTKHIKAKNITQRFMDYEEFKVQMRIVMAKWVKWQTLLELSTILKEEN